jgi:CDP-diacylglycerol--glycerol-3-phosphate 3-phosphatidyltransferase
MQDEKKFRWTIPNVLSLYRILLFPFILYMVFIGEKQIFICMLLVNLVTDILDGFIARTFNQKTAIGARLDSVADIFTYLLALAGLLKFQWPLLLEYWPLLTLFFVLYIFGFIISFIRFGRVAGLHIYSFKLTGYLQGIFIFVLFFFGFYEWFFYVMILWGIWANIEDIIILFILPQARSNVKGLYWVIRDLKKG